MQGTKLLGVVSRDDILRSLATELSDSYVTGIMHRDVLMVDAGLTLEEVREQMNTTNQRLAAVYRGDAFLGLVSREDLAEALLVIGFSKAHEARQKAAMGAP
jgi:CBS domain-containing protein